MGKQQPFIKRAKKSQFMEEAGHELGFFRNIEEIKSLASIGKWWEKEKDADEKTKKDDE
ncbi:hypothetical protein SAMN05192534_101196 [Alteribacillus persepolensis]|uniref:Uncharacterized protein n=1 Tax=Alteribacillus persepolensis TaxID=568899 RepID=A0A1G7YLE6_9BACI|nr:hypothetical protein [Alteribacillus persepolensis]SDG97358.1 hypothetical protein SAMN05192534_101196 [Alteribacillus persepolensis]